ncbi:ABC transporter permease [Roseococcus suduntuyensis]|uniref:Simple sugar transport system permease protein n=1 Tax=Roseococcus suduntuyensis TaxID=455361 RepID=A0A840A9Q7_9PROT|nr:ABC transporter permease [Roseococcus suduntuyensis]MBB3897246.1 simple sugar transport system permease protein [Roseococcus suduntuyensis]
MTLFEAILLTVITASTPLLIAAIGELVVERSGVLNLGVEGMMIMGAAVGIAAAITTGSSAFGVLAAVLAGMAMAALFALLTLGLATNQVAVGLALAIFGLGLSGVVGAPFVGVQREGIGAIAIPYLSDIPFIGPVLFAQDPFVYAAFALVAGVSWFLFRTRAGLVLRACGENHASAHALGHHVLRVRFLAVLFGGACAGLAGAYLSLVYTPFWTSGMTAGRGWIALAIVVFASWLPWRAAVGAYLFGGVTILQLHAQSAGVPLPTQLLAAMPYLITILVLVLVMRLRGGGAGPAALGQPFVPDR